MYCELIMCHLLLSSDRKPLIALYTPIKMRYETIQATNLEPHYEASKSRLEVHQTSKASNEKSWLRRAAEEAFRAFCHRVCVRAFTCVLSGASLETERVNA